MNVEFIVKVIELFRKDLSLEFTILQLSKKSSLSYNAAHRTVQALIKQDILSYRKIGGSTVITLSKTLPSLGYLSLIESFHSKTTKDFTKKVDDYSEKFA